MGTGLANHGGFVGTYGPGFCFVSPGKDGEWFLCEVLTEPDDHWGFSRAASGNVSDAYHGDGNFMCAKNLYVIEGISHSNNQAVDERKGF